MVFNDCMYNPNGTISMASSKSILKRGSDVWMACPWMAHAWMAYGEFRMGRIRYVC